MKFLLSIKSWQNYQTDSILLDFYSPPHNLTPDPLTPPHPSLQEKKNLSGTFYMDVDLYPLYGSGRIF